MGPVRHAVFTMLIAGCASGGPSSNAADATGDDDAPPGRDAREADAPERPDAPANACAFSGVLATWSFTGDAGSQASTPATSTAQGVTAGDVQRATTLTAVSGANSINSSNWPSAAQRDDTKYYTLTITPPTGCMLDLTSAAVDAHSSGTGPTKASIATSADSFGPGQTVSTTAASTPALTVTNQTDTLAIRIYGWTASGAAGTMRLQNTLTLTGSLH
jgi:hypothetical protein